MTLTISFLDHLLPIIIVIFVAVAVTAMKIGAPYCEYIDYLTKANTRRGQEDLARYLAKKAGGRNIDVTASWRSFIPAAAVLHRKHMEKRQSLR